MSTINEVEYFLQELADSPSDYERQGNIIELSRQGRTYLLELKQIPGQGIIIEGQSDLGRLPPAPLKSFIQRSLLDLPRLALQIVKTIESIEKMAVSRPAKYVDGPAEIEIGKSDSAVWERTEKQFRDYLSTVEPGSTRLIQLMAAAGQGKTVLLEQLAKETALVYKAENEPTPFLLTIDLLGRYVGTIDDAIAGSLSNTYMFPSLTQRDVALCIRNGWIILALDGFDELVQRIGEREAFQRITELLDQLKGSGTVILSARESFFELYQITTAIRSYLQPKIGSYSTSIVRLKPWKEAQGESVFRSLGSDSPKEELQNLLNVFENDREIVLQPFFLTRLAKLWLSGERFDEAHGSNDPRKKTEYIIQKFIDRETNEKWKTRENKVLLDTYGHTLMLSGIAEEMWRSGAFRLSDEEVRLAAQIALSPLDLPGPVLDGIIERVPTHAALIPRDRGYSFVHDRFFTYYLSVRLKEVFTEGNANIAKTLIEQRELSQDCIFWMDWLVKEKDDQKEPVISNAISFSKIQTNSKIFETNLGSILALLLHDSKDSPFEIPNVIFTGDYLKTQKYSNISFTNCKFWRIDLSDSQFYFCIFLNCQFIGFLLKPLTSFSSSTFIDCTFSDLENIEGSTLFGPEKIKVELEKHGAKIQLSSEILAKQQFANRISQSAIDCVSKIVRMANRTTDIAIEDIEEFPNCDGGKIVQAGINTGIFKEVQRPTSGIRKTFVRFQVDRQLLLKGQAERTGETRIDSFWDLISKNFPRQN